MSLSKLEAQRLMERVSKLESQVYSINFKLTNMENMLKADSILRKVREAEADEKRKAEKEDLGDLVADLRSTPKGPEVK